jgi:colicin import membrane protein
VAASLSPMFPERARGGSKAASFALAFAMHCLLFAFLYFGIRWQSHPPAAVEAELWSEPPRVAAPVPVPVPVPAPEPEPPKPVVRDEPKPEPAPPKPDIAVKEEAKKPPPKKEEKPKVEPRTEDKAKPKIEDDPIQRELRKEEIKQQLAREAQRDQLAQKAAADTALQGQKAAQEWGDRVRAKVRSRISVPIAAAVPGNPEAMFEVSILPGYEVGTVRKLKSSGNAAYDEDAERAIKAASPFPPPAAGTPPQRTITLRMKPKDE